MRVRFRTTPPKPWAEHSEGIASWMVPFYRFEWYMAWIAWALSNWAVLDVLEQIGTFSILIGVVFYFSERGDRVKQKHYQAWQVINSANGKGGSGGRIEALQELNTDHISLIGVDAGGSFLRGIVLENAKLSRCDLHASDIRDSDFAGASLDFCDLQDANFRNANLRSAKMESANLHSADLNGANLQNADLPGVDLSEADLRGADLKDIHWQAIRSIHLANLAGAKNVSPEFLAFATENGAVSLDSDAAWEALQK